MSYRVIYAPSIADDIREHVAFLRSRRAGDEVIEAWYARLFETIDALAHAPRRCPVDTASSRRLHREIRKLNVGEYLVCYEVDDTHQNVRIVALEHGATRRGS